MKIGFTGTRNGTTTQQMMQVNALLDALAWAHRHGPVSSARSMEFHHGGAVDADRKAAKLARHIGYEVHWHPCPGVALSDVMQDDPDAVNDIWHEVFPPLTRNRDIVDVSGVLIAVPKKREEELRSGTWATIRYARKVGRLTMMVWP